MTVRPLVTAAALLITLVATGCGGDQPSSGSARAENEVRPLAELALKAWGADPKAAPAMLKTFACRPSDAATDEFSCSITFNSLDSAVWDRVKFDGDRTFISDTCFENKIYGEPDAEPVRKCSKLGDR